MRKIDYFFGWTSFTFKFLFVPSLNVLMGVPRLHRQNHLDGKEENEARWRAHNFRKQVLRVWKSFCVCMLHTSFMQIDIGHLLQCVSQLDKQVFWFLFCRPFVSLLCFFLLSFFRFSAVHARFAYYIHLIFSLKKKKRFFFPIVGRIYFGFFSPNAIVLELNDFRNAAFCFALFLCYC